MSGDDLLDAIGQADDRQIWDARRGRGWRRWWPAVTAACLILVISGLNFAIEQGWGAAGGGYGSSGDLSYMWHEGPVLPLTLQGDGDGITAVRSVNFDFSPYEVKTEPVQNPDGTTGSIRYFDRAAVITDRYTLTNTTGRDKTVTALYPFAGG